jgi:hypothetical protein
MPTFLLDMVVEGAQLYSPCSTIRTPIWITIRADGLQQPFDTPSVPASPRPSWRTPVRLVLNLPNLATGHFKATLRTTGYLGEILSVACSQVRLSNLPVGRPAHFQFPLQNTQDFAIQAATLSITASIREVALQPRPLPQPEIPPGAWQQPGIAAPPWATTTAPVQIPPPQDDWRRYPGSVPGMTPRRH